MKKILTLVAVFALLSLLVFGCTKSYQYPTGYSAYSQQGQQPYQGYVGGGCAVASPDLGTLDVSDEKLFILAA